MNIYGDDALPVGTPARMRRRSKNKDALHFDLLLRRVECRVLWEQDGRWELARTNGMYMRIVLVRASK